MVFVSCLLCIVGCGMGFVISFILYCLDVILLMMVDVLCVSSVMLIFGCVCEKCVMSLGSRLSVMVGELVMCSVLCCIVWICLVVCVMWLSLMNVCLIFLYSMCVCVVGVKCFCCCLNSMKLIWFLRLVISWFMVGCEIWRLCVVCVMVWCCIIV